MSSDHVIYRLPGAVFPLKFEMHGQSWELRVFEVHGAGAWRCYLEGPRTFAIANEADENRVLRSLRETGVEIPSHSLAGTVFRHLERVGIAERVHTG